MVTTAFSWGWAHHDLELFHFSFSSSSTFVSPLLDRTTGAMKGNVGSRRKPLLLAMTCSGEGENLRQKEKYGKRNADLQLYSQKNKIKIQATGNQRECRGRRKISHN